MAFRSISLCLMLATAYAGIANARDLRGDPERGAILDAARANEPIQFIVRDLFKDGNSAYLCALQVRDGAVDRTDDQFDVHKWALAKSASGWHAVELGSGLAASSTKGDCSVCDHAIRSAADIKTAADPGQCVANKPAWKITYREEAVQKVRDIIGRHRLTRVPGKCLDYLAEVSSDLSRFDVDVHERHDQLCGGDPSTSPRLFSFEIDRRSGTVRTDATSPDGSEMLPIS